MTLDRLAGATVVFDLDGTLVDTAPDIAAVLNGLLAYKGLEPMTLERIKPMIGRGAHALLSSAFEAAGRPLVEPELSELWHKLSQDYRARIAVDSRPFPGAVAAVDRLAAHGARLAICTNKRTELAVALLDALRLTDRFAAVVGPDLAGAAKPDPAHLVATIARAGGQIDKAVMVGDSASDAGAARAAGIPLILVDFGYTDIPAAALAPDGLIGHFDELVGACVQLLAARTQAIGRTPATDA